MKKFLLSLSGAAILVACNSKPAEVTAVQPQVQQAVDTTGLAAFKNFQTEQAIAAAYANELPAQEEAPKVYKAPVAKAVKQLAPVRTVAKRTSTSSAQTSSNTSSSGSSNTASTGSYPDVSTGDAGSGTESAGETASTSEKKVSNATKGAVIGGVVGAGTGAVINKKNRVIGAVIGGVVGAGGGYVIGKKTEKKNK
jgi:cobalamin biosynthesis Mg chelatase CobN